MATRFRDWEILYEDIIHIDKTLTTNQAISVLIVESFHFPHEEKLEVSFIICKLEYLRFKKMFSDELGDAMYETVCDIFDETPKFQQHKNLEKLVDEFITSHNQRLTQQDYHRILPIVAPYFRFNPDRYKKEAFKLLFPASPTVNHTPKAVAPSKKNKKSKGRKGGLFSWK